MRLEEITKQELCTVQDKQLLVMKLRFTQLWDKNFKDNTTAVVGSLNRSSFLRKYKLLLDEMGSRELKHSTCDIDKATFRKAMTAVKFGIDVTDLEDVVLADSCVSLIKSGDEVVLVVPDISFDEEMQEVLEKLFSNYTHTEKAEVAHIPLFDLVLRAKSETVRVEVSEVTIKRDTKKLWSSKYIEELPDSSFLLIGTKKRHFPYVSIEGKVCKTRLKDALASLPKSKLAVNTQAKLKVDIEKLLEDLQDGKQFDRYVHVFPVEKADKDEQIVCGIVYEPDVVDAQGDQASEIEIQKAAYKFMEKVQTFKVMHKGAKVNVKILESYLAPIDFSIANKFIKKGTWLMTVRVLNKKIWELVKSGDLAGFSMAGYAKAEVVE